MLLVLLSSMTGFSKSEDEPARVIEYEVMTCRVKDIKDAETKLQKILHLQDEGRGRVFECFSLMVDEPDIPELQKFFSQESMIMATRTRVLENSTAKIAQDSEKDGYSLEIKGKVLSQNGIEEKIQTTINFESWKLEAVQGEGVNEMELRNKSGLQTSISLLSQNKKGTIFVSGDMIVFFSASIAPPSE